MTKLTHNDCINVPHTLLVVEAAQHASRLLVVTLAVPIQTLPELRDLRRYNDSMGDETFQ